jgi:Ion channel
VAVGVGLADTLSTPGFSQACVCGSSFDRDDHPETLATVGYGDYGAASNLGLMLSVLEAQIGQLYLATVIAVLVSRFAFPAEKRRQAVSATTLFAGSS